MSYSSKTMEPCHPQQAIWQKCFHPSRSFVEFRKEEVEQSIPSRFEKIARKYPDRVAVKMGDKVVTYSELNAMGNRVAHAIVAERGSDPEPVGLLFETNTALLASMLGVWKSGKFFVLFDPSFPMERNLAISRETSTKLILVDSKNAPLGSKLANLSCKLIEFESINSNVSFDDPRLEISPDALAYVVYTSGSTGQPKGVIHSHRCRMHTVMLYSNMFHLEPADRCILLTSGTGNTIGNSLFALLNGAALYPINVKKQGLSPLAGWMVEEKISVCAISAPLFRKLCESLTGAEKFSELRILRLTSEAAYKSDFDLYKRFFPRTCFLANIVSPTEAGILRKYLMDHETQIHSNEVPLGFPVEDKEILLLDDEGKEVEFNEVGQIVVRSKYLSPGYWNNPDLTAAKFKPDPEDPEKRIYYTGDLGLMLPDGCLIHEGRKDFRVKIRGYGVDIAEVQKAMLDHPAIKEAVVVTRQNELSEVRLDAYFTSPVHPDPSVNDLRGFLQKKLPDYMIPSAFVKLDAIPLTPNGKVDRHALPIPDNSRPELDTPYTEPTTSIEKKLADIWKEVLGVDQIGIRDDFFDLGGHSLTAMRVISRIHSDLQVTLPLRRFFETPTITALSDCIERTGDGGDRTNDFIIKRASKEVPSLPSFAQQRLWFLDQLAPGDSAFNMISVYRLTGQLNVPALEQSFNEIIKRHESWRTIFKAVDGEPRQVVLPSLTIKMSIVELREIVSAAEQEFEFQRLVAAEARQAFDLADGPLLRVTLLRLKEDEHVSLLTKHHIVYDGWSREIIARELSHHYEAFASGRASSLPELSIQYGDYAHWQRQRLKEELIQEQLSYWRRQLENPSILQLPTDRSRPPIHTSCGARRHFVLSDTLSAAIMELSNRCGVTLFMTLFAAYQTMLHRYSGQNDISVGTPIAARNHPDLEALIGMFLNMLVLRIDLSRNPTFRELLARVRDVCVSAYAHQDLPFEKLVEELHPTRSLSHDPLFQVTFGLRNMPWASLELVGLAVEELEIDPRTSRFDLELLIEQEERGLRGFINYNTDLFDAATIERMLSHFENLLQNIVVDPDQRLSELPMLPETEKHQLLVEWNDTKGDYPKDKCIHQLFEAQVERTPDVVAVVFEDQSLTYRELDQRAEQLARHLRAFGVRPDVLVGICMERSADLVIGVLGILKAGGAYVPIDPAYPAERIAFLIEDSAMTVLLTQERLLGNLPENPCRVVSVERLALERELDAIEVITEPARSDHLAYVIYTSGSTGRPKGVAIQHKALVNFLHSMRQRPGMTPQDVLLSVTTISFDIAGLELFVPLIVGARVVLVSREVAADGRRLMEQLEDSEATVMQATPATWRMLLDSGWSGSKDLKILCGGEALSLDLAKALSGRSSSVWNLYGPTETTVWSTVWKVDPSYGRISIGRPIANTQAYVLDANLEPVPVGVAGELYLGGNGVAKGYLNRPELTAEKFISNPFSNDPRARLYKTGDLVRYLPGGNIEFLGRLDNQVKIRGLRIEVGEIESVLGQQPGVRETIVAVREDNPEDRCLVAYVVPNQESVPASSELRSFLKSKLPEYMVPSAFVFLDALPLTPNGKVDRRALPIPDGNRPDMEEAFVAPRTSVEEALAGIWAEVLGVERVSIHDNFFELGGHSLLATQVMSRVRAAFQVELPLRALFETPTVADLAVAIVQTQADEETARLLRELDVISDQEAQRRLAQTMQGKES